MSVESLLQERDDVDPAALLASINPDHLSQAAILSLADEASRAAFLDAVDLDRLEYDWDFHARPSQLEATRSNAFITLAMAGRGWGKTRVGSEWTREQVRPGMPPTRGFFCARTAADVRTMLTGESGILNTFPPSEMPRWIRSERLIEFANGSTALTMSAKEPDQARGPSADWAWCDEWAAWDFGNGIESGELDLWENVQIAVRDAIYPKLLLTTTPKRIKQVREMVARGLKGDSGVKLVTGSTFENVALSTTYFQNMIGLYGGTKLSAQELFAQIIDDIVGSLWTEQQLADLRTSVDPGKLPLRVIGVDPSVADEPKDECGIIAMGATNEPNPVHRRGWVLADYSLQAPPAKWAKVVVNAAREHQATVIVEANQGGAMCREMIHNVDPTIRVRLVHAKQSKKLRAEPVSGVYEQGRIRHLGRFPEMEDQMTTWIPEETKKSPDRVDGMVHAATALLLPQGRGKVQTPSRASSPARGVIIPTGARVARFGGQNRYTGPRTPGVGGRR